MPEPLVCVLSKEDPDWVRAEKARLWLFRLNRERKKFVEQQTAAAAEIFFDAYRGGDNPYRRLLFKPRCVDPPSDLWLWRPLDRPGNLAARFAIMMYELDVDVVKTTGARTLRVTAR